MASPLKNLKILDFSTLLPGPYATMLMADMGARVTRITNPTHVDLTEAMPPFIGKSSALSAQLNHQKDSLALDLKKPDSIKHIKQILSEFDIVIEQFRPGVMKRLGLDYESLKHIKPDLIYCSITGYGQTGPYADRAGHDINYLAISGVAGYSGRASDGPSLDGIQVADMAGGSHHAVMAILAAMIHKHATGEGQYIDISITDCTFAMNVIHGSALLAGGDPPKPEKELLNGGFFYDYYTTSDNRTLSVGGLEPKFIKRLAELLDLPQLQQHAMNPSAVIQADIKMQLIERFQEKPLSYWRTLFEAEDICIEPVLTLDESIEHPHIQARKLIQEKEIEGTLVKQLASPIKFSQ